MTARQESCGLEQKARGYLTIHFWGGGYQSCIKMYNLVKSLTDSQRRENPRNLQLIHLAKAAFHWLSTLRLPAQHVARLDGTTTQRDLLLEASEAGRH